MKKIHTIQQIIEQGVIAVLRGESPEQVIEMAKQAIVGGIRVIEVTLTVPSALKAIEQLKKRYISTVEDERFAIIGAGTVLDPETARLAILHGAEFVVAPSVNRETIQLCNRYRIPIMPGVMTVKEAQEALEYGVDIVKLFPGSFAGPDMIKALHGPLPQLNIMPTGGVNVENLGDWIRSGAVAVGIGSDLTAEAIRSGDMTRVAQKAAQYVQAYRTACLNKPF